MKYPSPPTFTRALVVGLLWNLLILNVYAWVSVRHDTSCTAFAPSHIVPLYKSLASHINHSFIPWGHRICSHGYACM
ncbi:hypothetical protein F5X99DRAFT_372750 [Biscogniauxia marginata]|nr:hypothetical protein F5X99DRAFT_372750 [Biscogniauxia marginata]